jgi:hypothetical protein
MTPDLYVLNWKSSYDVMLFICAIVRPGICKNITFLPTILNLRIISIKRFLSAVHACVNGADALTNFT